MKPETAARMNELGRMTEDERRRSIAREVFGPLLNIVRPPDPPTDMPVPTMGEEG